MFVPGAGQLGGLVKVIKTGNGIIELPLHMMFVKILTGVGLMMITVIESYSRNEKMRLFLNCIMVHNETTYLCASLAL
jgi:hypothetical protein